MVYGTFQNSQNVVQLFIGVINRVEFKRCVTELEIGNAFDSILKPLDDVPVQIIVIM